MTWPMVRLDKLVDIQIGKTPARNTPVYWGAGHPWLSIGDMGDRLRVSETRETITSAAVQKCGMKLVTAGTVLLSFKLSIGKVARAGRDLFTNEAIAALPIKDERRLEGQYLLWALRSSDLTAGLDRAAKGLTLNKPKLQALRVPLPPLEEQRRIAAILDQADALRRKRRKSIEMLDGLTNALFLAVFGDPKKVPDRWPTLSFDEACNDETSRSEKLQRGDYLSEGLYRVVDQGQNEIAGWSDDDALLCRSEAPVVVFGDHTRAVKYVDFPFIIGADGAKVLKPTSAYAPAFFAHLLRRMPLPDLGYSRHMREVKRLRFPQPPLPLQIEFVARIASLEEQRSILQAHGAHLDALFASLQQRAFSGELSAAAAERALDAA